MQAGGRPDPKQLKADMQLVQSALAGNQKAARALGERMRCVPRILKVLNARRGGRLNTNELEDIGQDVALSVLSKLKDFHGRSTFEGWVHRFAFHHLMNALRVRGRRSALFVSADAQLMDVPADREKSRLDYEHVEKALRYIDPQEIDVIRLKHYEDLSFVEIGDVLEISPNTAKTRYYRAMRNLEERLGSLEEAAPE